jgi:hypothetical protein
MFHNQGQYSEQRDRQPKEDEWVTWLVWSVAQVGWLGLMAGRVKLSAKWPETGETWSAIGMVAVQLFLACVMGQALLKQWCDWVYASTVAVPMLALAMVQSGSTLSQSVPGMVNLMLWLGVLTWIGSIRSLAVHSLLKSIMLILTVGGPVFLYLVWEFGRRAIAGDGVIAYVSPTLGVVTVLHQGWEAVGMIGVPVGFLIIVTGIHSLLCRRITHQKSIS